MYHDDAKHGPSCFMSMKYPVLHESFIKWHNDWYVILFLPQTWSPFLPCLNNKNKNQSNCFILRLINESSVRVICFSFITVEICLLTMLKRDLQKTFSETTNKLSYFSLSSSRLPPGFDFVPRRRPNSFPLLLISFSTSYLSTGTNAPEVISIYPNETIMKTPDSIICLVAKLLNVFASSLLS